MRSISVNLFLFNRDFMPYYIWQPFCFFWGISPLFLGASVGNFYGTNSSHLSSVSCWEKNKCLFLAELSELHMVTYKWVWSCRQCSETHEENIHNWQRFYWFYYVTRTHTHKKNTRGHTHTHTEGILIRLTCKIPQIFTELLNNEWINSFAWGHSSAM